MPGNPKTTALAPVRPLVKTPNPPGVSGLQAGLPGALVRTHGTTIALHAVPGPRPAPQGDMQCNIPMY